MDVKAFIQKHKPLLDIFAGSHDHDTTDGVWRDLLAFPAPLTRLPPVDLQVAVAPFCDQLVLNNAATHHFQKLAHHVMALLEKLERQPQASQQAANAVYFLRLIVKHLTENLSAAQLVGFVNGERLANGSAASHVAAEPLLHSLVRRTISTLLLSKRPKQEASQAGAKQRQPLPLSAAAYLLEWELVNLLIVMMSTQLYTPTAMAAPQAHPFTAAILEQRDLVPGLLQYLLERFIEVEAVPKGAPVYQPPEEKQRGVFRLVRSAAVSVLWLPLRAYTFLIRSGGSQVSASPLAESSLLLLLALLHHAPASEEAQANPFRQAFASMQNADEAGSDSAAEAGFSGGNALAAVSFSALYEALGKRLGNERTVLLLYDALHTCVYFQNYVLVRSDLEVLLLPLLHMLYTAPGRAPSHLYMLLIILLILTQDASFAANVHKVQLSSVPWYRERLLNKTLLGSLLVVLLLRTAHYNLAKLRDVYLHTNTLAALANLAPYAQDLSSHAAQRLVSLFDMLARRYQRLQRVAEEEGDKADELQVYADFLRIVLEILNCILVTNLPANPELVYAMLHQQEIFMPFQGDAVFGELTENITAVIRYFNAQVEQARGFGGWDWSVEKVLDVIKESMKGWRTDKLRRFPELHFTYEEETSPEEFFVPYVWTFVVNHSSIAWNSQAIALFSPLGSAMSASSQTLDRLDSASLTKHSSAASEILWQQDR
ncbi:g1983 [Coccomyxa viridis]|uniref:Dymeclin n=1 Tax=Coccomyxa viridis TaxID=1274662 RepID=A0ABP1FJB0_9CHLO